MKREEYLVPVTPAPEERCAKCGAPLRIIYIQGKPIRLDLRFKRVMKKSLPLAPQHDCRVKPRNA